MTFDPDPVDVERMFVDMELDYDEGVISEDDLLICHTIEDKEEINEYFQTLEYDLFKEEQCDAEV
ncbi:MAG: hypothetical protein COA84_13130 [Robiginitomaculum sp.]|nr:MAG: hypothetical protein COA84_13130 [Robiginitomaculum sp.]